MDIYFSSRFKKQYKRSPKKVQKQFDARLNTLVENPRGSGLHIHKLSGKYKGLWSMNVTGDIRAIFEKTDGMKDGYILFVAIGSHSQLYL